jgi:methionyl-tRNA synthetase
MNTYYVTTAIPYVNAAPHLGHALELVQADALARHRRLRGQPVRFLTGTDDNALKNVAAARAAGVPTATFVAGNTARFAALREPLALSFDDFIATSTDARHAPGVDALWRRCDAAGDLYRRAYRGLYCTGCEQFYEPSELDGGVCPEHRTVPEAVEEKNWFFRLSRYGDILLRLLESDEVRIVARGRRNEVLGFVRAGLRDLSVSRPAARAGGWGIPVPDDPDQVVYVWWDALTNYVTALGYADGDPAYRRWWAGDGERVHVIGKGIVRFHAVYWLALLLSAGEPLPTTIVVHDYLTAGGAKLSKSTGNTVDPAALVGRYGTDAVRWWLLRDVATVGDTDFTAARLVERANQDLANGLGNLVNRTVSLVRRYRSGLVPHGADGCSDLPARIDAALAAFDFRAAAGALCADVDATNRLVDAAEPWRLARAERDGDAGAGERLDEVLAVLVDSCRVLAAEARPFIPVGAARLLDQLGEADRVGVPHPVFERLT